MNRLLKFGLAAGLSLAASSALATFPTGIHVYPITGSLVVTHTDSNDTAYVIKNFVAGKRALILSMLGIFPDVPDSSLDADTKTFIAQNVLGVAWDWGGSCVGELVTYNPATDLVTGEIAQITTCDSNSAVAYNHSTNTGPYRVMTIAYMQFYGTDQFGHTSILSGTVFGVGTLNLTMDGEPDNGVTASIVRLQSYNLSVQGTPVIVTNGAFVVNFTTNSHEGLGTTTHCMNYFTAGCA